MILVDANLLIYAHDESAAFHPAARGWLERALDGAEPVGLPLQSILAFVRLTTNASLFARPIEPSTALETVRRWLQRPLVSIPEPGDRHWSLFEDACVAGQARGPRVMDAHLAALAIEHGATLATVDRGFGRFPGLRFINPLLPPRGQ